jgi:hypothetical protein
MRHSSFKFALLPLLTVALALGGCERVELPGTPSVPEFSSAGLHALHKVPERVRTATAGSTSGAIIGPEGGTIELAGHRLTVPAGAVTRPTRFSMRLVGNGYVEVDLRAAQASAAGGETDVGKRGFARPVVLSLSYAQAQVPEDLSRVVIAWVKPDGTLQPLTSEHDAQKQSIAAELDHFSGYVLATM